MKIEITAYKGRDKIKAYLKIIINNIIHMIMYQIRVNNGVEYISLPNFEHKKKYKYYFELSKELKELLLKNYKMGERVTVFVRDKGEER